MPPGFSQFLSNRGYLHPFWDGTFFMYGVGERPRTVRIHDSFHMMPRKHSPIFSSLTEYLLAHRIGNV